ncbi:MAG: hypothetical protein LUC93_04260 [Planctomycetaceae bacterium]|nr:hypothetical protein [Planctomycetaceae bacterium]
MTIKDLVIDPWEIWPDGIIPAEGNRPEWRLRTPEEGKSWLRELAESRVIPKKVPVDISALDMVREERNER